MTGSTKTWNPESGIRNPEPEMETETETEREYLIRERWLLVIDFENKYIINDRKLLNRF